MITCEPNDTMKAFHDRTPLDEAESQDLFAMLDQASSDPELLQILASDFAAFLSTTPSPAPGEDCLNASVRKGDWEPLVSQAAAALRARLLGARN